MAIKSILILGYGRMGQWFAHQLSKDYYTAVLEKQPISNEAPSDIHFIKHAREIRFINPDLILNAVNLNSTLTAFNSIIDHLPENVILSDITSVKNGIKEYYQNKNLRFVSTHPMFGPTFGDMSNLKNENAIIIEESDEEGKIFFEKLYYSLDITNHFASFENHDELMAESLSLPFLTALSFMFNADRTTFPGTTYQKQMDISEKLLSEDIHLLSEVLMNVHSLKKIEEIRNFMNSFYKIIEAKDYNALKSILEKLNENHKSAEVINKFL